jgi:hypothetical protein
VLVATEFKINEFEFGDTAGNGFWLVQHYRNHLQYNAVLAARTPPVLLPEFPILTVEAGKIGRKSWLNSHQDWHELLRPLANATGVDLSEVNMDNEAEFYAWLDAHAAEHRFLDAFFGIA